jgi:hypothetical protein
MLVNKGADPQALTKPRPEEPLQGQDPLVTGDPKPPAVAPAVPAYSPLDLARAANKRDVVEYLTSVEKKPGGAGKPPGNKP